jgi:signal transduction histidine kinase
MKLLFKVTLYYLIITLIVFGIGGVMTYNIFQRQVEKETDRYLVSRLWEIENSIENGESPSAFYFRNLTIREVDNSIDETKFHFSDTLADHPSPFIDRLESHRKLSVIRKIHDQTFKIEMFDVIVESDDIIRGVFQSQTRLFIILGSVLVISSFLVSIWLFRPFYITLQTIKKFRLNDNSALVLGQTKTKEFRELNLILDQMIKKIRSDYRNLKEFSENASHEMQTPLAVAKGKLELMLQSKSLDEEQLTLINSAYNSIDHLSKMGRSLGLLTKIENNEFTNLQETNITGIINNALFDFQELLELKGISTETDLQEDVIINSDPTLMKILIGNLFQNAVRHNIVGGKIQLRLTNDEFYISNTGKELHTSSELLFERFKKDNQSGETIGLGLAIVQKICEINGFLITYTFDCELHNLIVKFRT